MSFIFLFLFSLFTSSRAVAQIAQDPFFIYNVCPNTTTYSKNSTYFANLRTLLSSLSSRSASYSTGFQNATAGQAIDRVTGLFLCRGDLSPEICRKCVAFAVNETLNYCPNEKEVTLYYEECMLRYSHRNILSTLRFDGGVILTNPYNISSNRTDQFEDFVSSTMNQAAVEAASSARKFYAIKARWTPLHILFGLVQCTPDLTRQDCLSCLQRSINGLPLYRLGGRLLYPSCNSRYELYAFYNETSIRSPPLRPPASSPPMSSPPVSSPPVSSPSRAGKGGNSNVLVVAIVVLVTVLFCFS